MEPVRATLARSLGIEGVGVVALIGAITSCISVIVAGSIAVLTLRQSRVESKSERAHRYTLEILPRRLDALESTWRMIFELEAGVSLSQDRIDQLIQTSIWLPSHIRDSLITLLIDPGK